MCNILRKDFFLVKKTEKCRTDVPHLQFSGGEPAAEFTTSDRYATSDDLAGCHERHDLPCYRAEVYLFSILRIYHFIWESKLYISASRRDFSGF